MNSLRKQFETEKQYPSWDCNDTVIMEYIEWLEKRMQVLSIFDVSNRRELLIAYEMGTDYGRKDSLRIMAEIKVDEFLSNL